MSIDIYNLQLKFTFAWSLAAIGLSYFDYHPGLQLIEDLKEIDILSGTRMKREFPVRLAIELAYMFGLCAMEVSISYPSPNVPLATVLFVNMYHGFTVLKVLVDHYTRHIKSVSKRFLVATDKLKDGDYSTAVTVHSKLISCAAKVTDVFGLEILLVLSVESCLIVYNLYNFRSLLESFQKDNKGTSLFIFISILWLVSWFSDIWNIVSTTEDMLDQSKTFNESLLKQIIEDSTGELAKNVS
ncbi:hypothetical protein O3M35_011578 [Rhynocoris fuscipes]|uniref:Gustatory receptor n=1 Tax=Rhynocoris fuscipes TaxID=488301 RepID=A0AAW1CWR3_9HEMI